MGWCFFVEDSSIHHLKLVSGSNGKQSASSGFEPQTLALVATPPTRWSVQHSTSWATETCPKKIIIWRWNVHSWPVVLSGWVPSMHMQSIWVCSFGHVSLAQEVECWTPHLVGGVATSTRIWGLNLEEAVCFPFEPEINLWWCMDESPTKKRLPTWRK